MAAKNYRYLTVDRVDSGTVILIDEKESVYRVTVEKLGFTPHDGDILRAETDAEGTVISAEIDTEATETRRTAMRAKLRGLLG